MLFNSYEFILVFLPIAVSGFYLLGRYLGARTGLAWLIGASLIFYGMWYPAHLVLIGTSILCNFTLGVLVDRNQGKRSKYILTTLGILFNLGLLGYYKYADFIADNLELVLPVLWDTEGIVLPLAISFFTFQQIAYLVDVYKGETNEPSLMRYSLFVTFFPQLIAGPIVHHKDLLPQFTFTGRIQLRYRNIAIGLTFFIIGLFKKVMLADNVALFATPTFDAVAAGQSVDFLQAWSAALAYSLQLYFDFSGYSDMAIGLAYMIGIRLPDNFNSPYKSASIIEFWRRWHMTLSAFLRHYVYIPLGGNRKGEYRRYTNLFLTMLIGGIWHGAGWTFVIWGALHGFYLLINHWWRAKTEQWQWRFNRTRTAAIISIGLTFLLVVIAWVIFRSDNLTAAMAMYQGMVGLNGFELHSNLLMPLVIYIPLLFIVFLLPNTKEFVLREFPENHTPVIWHRRLLKLTGWQANWIYATGISAAMVLSILEIGQTTEFLYFQF